MAEALFTNLCPNCEGEIKDHRLRIKHPCEVCIDREIDIDDFEKLVELIKLNLNRPGKYDIIADTYIKLNEFSHFFNRVTGKYPWSAQKSWAKRLFLGKSFSIVAPTGVGKSVFGTVFAAYLSTKGKRSYIIVPTSTLVHQTVERLKQFGFENVVVGYHSNMKQKERTEAVNRISKGDFNILVTTSQFLARKFDEIKHITFDFVFVDDVDAFLKASKNIDRVLQLIGFDEDIINTAYRLVVEKIKAVRGRADEALIEQLEKKIEEFRSSKKVGQIVVASATGRASGLRVKLFRELLDFEVGSTRANLRNIVNTYTDLTDIDKVVETVVRLGSGGIIFVAQGMEEEVYEKLRDTINRKGLKAEIATSGKAVKVLEEFREGNIDVLIGSAYYYGTLVRGIDMPERVIYTVFVGVPRFRFGLDFEGITPSRLAFISDVVASVTGSEEIRRLANRVRRYGREEDVERLKDLLKQYLSDKNVLEKLKTSDDLIIEEENGELRIVVPDYKTYIQGSGRASRMYAGGVTKGLSVLFVDHKKAFQMLKRILFYLYGEEFVEFENINIDELIKELRGERKKIKRSDSMKDPVKTVLFIVESPNKARTIARFFGRPSTIRYGNIRGYEVAVGKYILTITATRGHMYDLVTDRGYHGVLVNGSFVPVYTTIKICRKCGTQTTENVCPKCGTSEFLEDAIERVNALRMMALQTDMAIIGTDPDTEGEKIAWDTFLTISPYIPTIARAEFHEVTKQAILKALEEVREINENRVNAQIVRRVEDRWIGFELSQKLWAVFNNRALSAGRVQTPVLGWIIDRYRESKKSIKVFVRVTADGFSISFETPFRSEKEAEEYVKDGKVRVVKIEEKVEYIQPKPPFTTDTLIRDAGNVLGFSAKKVMDLAQDLFESGLITYHRTDSTHVSSTGISLAKEFVTNKYGEEYFRGRKWGEEGAHECIRPTRPLDTETLIRYIRDGEITVEGLKKDHFRLYDLIFKRFMESQMKEAEVKVGKYLVTLEALRKEVEQLDELLFPGWMIMEKISDPVLKEGTFEISDVRSYKAPTVPLYTQSDVVALMKERGIGRPSTYATIVQKLLDRKYVIEVRRKLIPTKRGVDVYTYLSSKFASLVSEERTRILEKLMDLIEEGKADYQEVLGELYREIISTRGII